MVSMLVIVWCILGFIGGGYFYQMFAWTGVDVKYNRNTQKLSRLGFIAGFPLLLVMLGYKIKDRESLKLWKNPFHKLAAPWK